MNMNIVVFQHNFNARSKLFMFLRLSLITKPISVQRIFNVLASVKVIKNSRSTRPARLGSHILDFKIKQGIVNGADETHEKRWTLLFLRMKQLANACAYN